MQTVNIKKKERARQAGQVRQVNKKERKELDN
jgi:hypothetical protein